MTSQRTRTPAASDRLWSPEETAEYLGVSLPTLRTWTYHGRGPRSFRVGKRRRYDPADVRAWLEANASSPAGGAA